MNSPPSHSVTSLARASSEVGNPHYIGGKQLFTTEGYVGSKKYDSANDASFFLKVFHAGSSPVVWSSLIG
jgi:hypothetical protein